MSTRLNKLWPRQQCVPDWPEQLNLMGPRARTASWAWVLCLAGLTTWGWLWPEWARLADEAQQVQADLHRLQRAQHRQQLQLQVTERRPTAVASAEAQQPLVTAKAAQMAQWLAYPWLKTLNDLDVAAGRHQAMLLDFQLDLSAWDGQAGTRPWAHISAVAPSDVAALQWMQALGEHAQLLGRTPMATGLDEAVRVGTLRVSLQWAGAAW